jgi:hypothetical protein
MKNREREREKKKLKRSKVEALKLTPTKRIQIFAATNTMNGKAME